MTWPTWHGLVARSAVRESMASVPDGITASVVPGNLGYFTARCQEPRDVMIYEEVARKGLSGYDLDTAKGWIHVIPGAKPVHCDQLGYADVSLAMGWGRARGSACRCDGQDRQMLCIPAALAAPVDDAAVEPEGRALGACAGGGARVPGGFPGTLHVAADAEQPGRGVRGAAGAVRGSYPQERPGVHCRRATRRCRRRVGGRVAGTHDVVVTDAAAVLTSAAEQIATEGGPFGGGYSVTCSRLVGPHAALVGDSAHGMLSTLGMGCNVALEGATVLAQCLGGESGVWGISARLCTCDGVVHLVTSSRLTMQPRACVVRTQPARTSQTSPAPSPRTTRGGTLTPWPPQRCRARLSSGEAPTQIAGLRQPSCLHLSLAACQ